MTKNSTPSSTLTDQDKLTLATAAHGAVGLLVAAAPQRGGQGPLAEPCGTTSFLGAG